MKATKKFQFKCIIHFTPRCTVRILHSMFYSPHTKTGMATSHIAAAQGWGLLGQLPPFRYFLNFSALSEHTLPIEYHVYIWQVSPQLSCGGTCQIYTRFKESKRYFCQIENFACGEINEQNFNTPHPGGGIVFKPTLMSLTHGGVPNRQWCY